MAIGKDGQNIRLASKVTGYEIDVERDETFENTLLSEIEGFEKFNRELSDLEIKNVSAFLESDDEVLLSVSGIGEKTLENLKSIVQQLRKKEIGK